MPVAVGVPRTTEGVGPAFSRAGMCRNVFRSRAGMPGYPEPQVSSLSKVLMGLDPASLDYQVLDDYMLQSAKFESLPKPVSSRRRSREKPPLFFTLRDKFDREEAYGRLAVALSKKISDPDEKSLYLDRLEVDYFRHFNADQYAAKVAQCPISEPGASIWHASSDSLEEKARSVHFKGIPESHWRPPKGAGRVTTPERGPMAISSVGVTRRALPLEPAASAAAADDGFFTWTPELLEFRIQKTLDSLEIRRETRLPPSRKEIVHRVNEAVRIGSRKRFLSREARLALDTKIKQDIAQHVLLRTPHDIVKKCVSGYAEGREYENPINYFSFSIPQCDTDDTDLFQVEKNDVWEIRMQVMILQAVRQFQSNRSPEMMPEAKRVFFERLYLALERFEGQTPDTPILSAEKVPTIYEKVRAKLFFLSQCYAAVSQDCFRGISMYPEDLPDSVAVDLLACDICDPSFSYHTLMNTPRYARLLRTALFDFPIDGEYYQDFFQSEKDLAWSRRMGSFMINAVGSLKTKAGALQEARLKHVFFMQLYLQLEESQGRPSDGFSLGPKQPVLSKDSPTPYEKMSSKLYFLSRYYLAISQGQLREVSMERRYSREMSTADFRAIRICHFNFTYEALLKEPHAEEFLGLGGIDKDGFGFPL